MGSSRWVVLASRRRVDTEFPIAVLWIVVGGGGGVAEGDVEDSLLLKFLRGLWFGKGRQKRAHSNITTQFGTRTTCCWEESGFLAILVSENPVMRQCTSGREYVRTISP